MQRFLNLQLVFPLEDFLRGWFLGAPFESILRNNVEEFVAYAFYCRRWSELDRKVCTLVSAQPPQPVVLALYRVSRHGGWASSMTQ